jgi:hypothetical protein
MAMIDIKWNPSIKELRWFGGLGILFFAGVASVMYFKHEAASAAGWTFGIAFTVCIIGLIVPKFMRIVYVVWMVLVFPLGFVISYLALIVVFYLVIAPIGLIMRLTGYDPMRLKRDPDADTYWVERKQEQDSARYFRQF